MSQCSSPCRSTVSRKLVVALTGALLFGFVVVHLSGNLLVFAGAEAMNQYARSLRDFGPLLWVARGGLLLLAIAHIWQALSLARRNRAARPRGYVRKDYVRATFASRSMVLTGLTLLAFIAFHLAHYTFRVVLNTGDHLDPLGHPDVFKMLVLGFQNVWVSATYVVAMGFLALHLSHAIPSVLQTFGVQRPAWRRPLEWVGKGVAAVIFLGYVSIPAAVLAGAIQLGGH